MQKNQLSVVCFGEILWDVLPGGALPGGAPMNVAYHLNKLGITATLITRVGNDEPGKKLVSLLKSWGISADHCQVDNDHKTSEVLAAVGENHEVKYDILFPVAWDFISFENEFETLLPNTNALVFGSLVARNDVSADTLRALLNFDNYKIFDINLRAPHYSPSTIKEFLNKTDLVKLNAAELIEVTGWYNSTVKTDEEAIKFLQDEFDIKEIIVTRGSQGASYFTPTSQFNFPAYKVDVADTIGSGDSFLAGFIAKKLQGEEPKTAIAYAAALAAFVTNHHGACPPYEIDEIEKFIRQKKVEMQ